MVCKALNHQQQQAEEGQDLSAARMDWVGRFQQLSDFYQEYGHTLVPKRHKENPTLGNWVNKQRQLYRKALLPGKKVDILNSIGFCWRCDIEDNTTEKSNVDWWQRLQEVKQGNYTSIADIPTRQGPWVKKQREAILSDQQLTALDELTFDWRKTQRETKWEHRYAELLQYRQEYGDCCVPISHSNKQLANWVSNQRKQYNRLKQGQSEALTLERQRLLEEAGFVWNLWEYEFTRKMVWKEGSNSFFRGCDY
jgi:hypothetical protein